MFQRIFNFFIFSQKFLEIWKKPAFQPAKILAAVFIFQIKHKKQLLKFKKWEQLFYNAGNDVIVAVFVLPPVIE